jgi:predicted RNase H-like HicB family nuclease
MDDMDPGGGYLMSTEPNTSRNQPSVEITLTRNDGGWWTARDETRGLTTQGETREEALSNLDSVVDAVENDAGHPPTDEELRAAGIDPETNRRMGSGELPDVIE